MSDLCISRVIRLAEDPARFGASRAIRRTASGLGRKRPEAGAAEGGS